MKTLICGLAAILTVALSGAVLAAGDDGVITGTVVSVTGDTFKIDEENGGSRNFELVVAGDFAAPKVGDRVRVHYYHCGSGRKGFHHCAKKLEKLGNAGGSSKKQ